MWETFKRDLSDMRITEESMIEYYYHRSYQEYLELIRRLDRTEIVKNLKERREEIKRREEEQRGKNRVKEYIINEKRKEREYKDHSNNE